MSVIRYEARCKNPKTLSYQVYDTFAGRWVEDTESPNWEEVERWAREMNENDVLNYDEQDRDRFDFQEDDYDHSFR